MFVSCFLQYLFLNATDRISDNPAVVVVSDRSVAAGFHPFTLINVSFKFCESGGFMKVNTCIGISMCIARTFSCDQCQKL